MRKLFPHPYLSVTLFVAWILLVNRAAIGSALMALVLAAALPHVTAAYWPGRAHIRHPLALARYVALVLWDVLTANIHVARLIRDGGDVRIDCAHRTLWKPDNSDLSVVVVEIYERQPGGLWRRTPTATLMVDAETTIGALATVTRMAAEYTEASAA
mgnify:CR=1 FL=1